MTVPDIEALFAKYYTKGLLLDTNLFLLLLVGSAAPAALLTFKPTVNQGFTRKDFELLAQIATRFSRLITTPHILTEACNHSDKLKGPLRAQVFGHLAAVSQGLEERSEASKQLCTREEFLRFGLTDTAISSIAPDQFLVLTVDFPLSGHLQKRGAAVVNFNHLRQMSWDLD